MPRKQVINIQSKISSLFSSIALGTEAQLNVNEISTELKLLLQFGKDPFEEIRSEYRLFNILKQFNLFEHPKLFSIDKQISTIISQGNPTLGAKSYDISILPLDFIFKSIFQIPPILDKTIKNTQENLIQSSICNYINASIFKNKILKFRNAIVIPFVIYFDDFQVNNPLGSHTLSICGCYINFPSMPQYLLSQLQYIFPAAFISSSHLKLYGNERSFHHLVEELKRLEDGIDISIGNEITKVHFVLRLVVGDNFAVNSIMGFVQSFNSKRYCRACSRTREQMQNDVGEVTEFLRNENDLLENNFQETGLKNVCVFNKLDNFNVMDNFCFDIMHYLYEGVCVYDVCNVLLALINSNILSLNDINGRKNLFQFGETEVGNCSIPLDFSRLKAFNLKMAASEVICFVHFLPLMIGDLIPLNNEYWQVLLILLDIIDLILKPSYVSVDLTNLQILVEKHHTMYLRLFGSLKPKHHFLVHYSTAIKKCGPLKYLWTMRFEAKHKEAKIYCHNTNSRVNTPYTLAIKAGLKFSAFLIDHDQFIEPILTYSTTILSNLIKDDFSYEINELVNIDLKKCNVCNDLVFKGTRYKSNYYLSINRISFELYKIKCLVIHEEKAFILCQKLEVKTFESHLRSYEMGCLIDKMYLKPNEEFTSPPLHIYPINNVVIC
ncbi:uncharacterized protein [Eurosta solidaginis]|uniref:uncharacterized protein isoform X1 n=1 Tax=Eurosta solidaginis TaxID=178769 RepID=UPI003530A5EC